MLKITAKLHLHFLTIVLAAICLICGKISIFGLTYSVMFIHELSHLLAAKFIGLRIEKICLYPFGVNLKLKNKIIHSLADECILYLAGPLSNGIMALIFLWIYSLKHDATSQFLYISNTVLGAVNLLPILPLDGGVILKKIFAYFFGIKKASLIMKCISVVLILGLTAVFVYGIVLTEYNFSVLMLCVFLTGNLFVGEEKYDVDFVKELMFYKNKSKNKINHIIENEENLTNIVHKFAKNKYNIVYCTDMEGKIKKIMTEDEIMDGIIGIGEQVCV